MLKATPENSPRRHATISNWGEMRCRPLRWLGRKTGVITVIETGDDLLVPMRYWLHASMWFVSTYPGGRDKHGARYLTITTPRNHTWIFGFGPPWHWKWGEWESGAKYWIAGLFGVYHWHPDTEVAQTCVEIREITLTRVLEVWRGEFEKRVGRSGEQ